MATCLASTEDVVPHEYSIFMHIEETGCTAVSKGIYNIGLNNQEKEREGQSRVETWNKDHWILDLLIAASGQRSMHERWGSMNTRGLHTWDTEVFWLLKMLQHPGSVFRCSKDPSTYLFCSVSKILVRYKLEEIFFLGGNYLLSAGPLWSTVLSLMKLHICHYS